MSQDLPVEQNLDVDDERSRGPGRRVVVVYDGVVREEGDLGVDVFILVPSSMTLRTVKLECFPLTRLV